MSIPHVHHYHHYTATPADPAQVQTQERLLVDVFLLLGGVAILLAIYSYLRKWSEMNAIQEARRIERQLQDDLQSAERWKKRFGRK